MCDNCAETIRLLDNCEYFLQKFQYRAFSGRPDLCVSVLVNNTGSVRALSRLCQQVCTVAERINAMHRGSSSHTHNTPKKRQNVCCCSGQFRVDTTQCASSSLIGMFRSMLGWAISQLKLKYTHRCQIKGIVVFHALLFTIVNWGGFFFIKGQSYTIGVHVY